MHKLVVTYLAPDDAQAFSDYYETHHLPLVRNLPGLLRSRFGYPEVIGGGDGAPFCIFEAEFESKENLFIALRSEAGKELAADIKNYSPKGATILHYAVNEVAP